MDYRSPQVREKVMKTLEEAIKDKPDRFLPIESDPRQLEDFIFQTSQTKEEYLKKIDNILQMANVSEQSQGPIDPIGHSSGAPQDPEKRKLIQQQLVLLLHALKCRGKDKTGRQSICKLPHCGTMKNVLTHMDACYQGRSCTVSHCASSRQILAHWITCNRADCLVCSPIRQNIDQKKTASGNSGLDGSSSSNASQDTAGSSAALSLASSVISDNVATLEFQLPEPEVASVQKEWHRQITLDIRNHLVSKLVKAVFPSPHPIALQDQDQRIKDLIEYARKVEKEIFETASDREGYYHLIAEKIYKLQKELQEKKLRRQGQPAADGASVSSNSETTSEVETDSKNAKVSRSIE